MDIVTLAAALAAARKYVDQKVIESGGVIVDPTLSNEGQAADAGVVGAELEKIKNSGGGAEAMTTEDIDKAIAGGGDTP